MNTLFQRTRRWWPLLLVFPLWLNARAYSGFANFTCSGGVLMRKNTPLLYGFDFTYDSFSRSCTHFSSYRGGGVVVNSNGTSSELGVRGLFNPTRWYLALNRNIAFFPFLFCQLHWVFDKSKVTHPVDNKLWQRLTVRPGLGFTSHYSTHYPRLRLSAFIGYDVPLATLDHLSIAFVAEIKVGIAFSAFRSRRPEPSEEPAK